MAVALATLPARPLRAQDAEWLVIRNVRVFPATGAPVMESATVVVRGERIHTVGPAADVDIPPGARVIEGRGRVLVPGLIEMHAHLSKTRASALGVLVVNGVTTVRDMGGEHAELLRWRGEIRSGGRIGPRLLIAGPYLESQSNIERMRRDPPEERVEPFERARIAVASPERATAIVDSLAGLELDFLKIRTVQDSATYRALNAAADRNGLRLVGHLPTGITPDAALQAGQDGIEHFIYPTLDARSREERMELWRGFAAAGVAMVPTLVVLEQSIMPPVERLRAVIEDSLGEIEPRRRYLSRFLVLDWREQLLEASDARRVAVRAVLPNIVRNLREMEETGVLILPGSDLAVLNIFPGSSLIDEMKLFVRDLGITPARVIERATRDAARFLGIADSVGTIEVGKVADLLLVDGDPLQDIDALRRPAGVTLRGRHFDRAELDALLARVLDTPDLRTNDWRRDDVPGR